MQLSEHRDPGTSDVVHVAKSLFVCCRAVRLYYTASTSNITCRQKQEVESILTDPPWWHAGKHAPLIFDSYKTGSSHQRSLLIMHPTRGPTHL